MTATLKQTRDDIRERLDEVSETFWKDEFLDRWIHDAATDIARRSKCLLDRQPIAVLAGIQEYTLPSDAIKVHRVEWQPENTVTVYPLEYYSWDVADGVWWTQQKTSQSPNPTIYTTWGYPPSAKITLYPTPSAPGTLQIYMYRLPRRAASDNADVDIPEGWTDLVYHFVEAVALRKDRDTRWQESRALYEDALQSMIETVESLTDVHGMIAAGRSVIPFWLYEQG